MRDLDPNNGITSRAPWSDHAVPGYTDDPGVYTAPQVCKLVGVSYRMLDYWCRCDVVPDTPRPLGPGDRRRFTALHVSSFRVVKEATRLGMHLSVVRRVFDLQPASGDVVAYDGERWWLCREWKQGKTLAYQVDAVLRRHGTMLAVPVQ